MPKAAQYLPDKNSLQRDKGINLKIYQCSGCGLVQLNNEPVPYYKEVIRASGISAEMRNFRLKQFNGFLNSYSLKGKKVIEIGCGAGEYLSLMNESGANAYGLEYSKSSIDICKNNGLNVYKGFIEKENYRLTGAPYQGFFILNFLEHWPKPNLTLSGISHNLTDDAVGLIEVPNFNLILRKNIFSEFITDHLYYFTKDTLTTTLSINGFEIIECQENFHDYIISAVVKKRKKLDLSHFTHSQIGLTHELNNFIHRFKPKKVAFWGAGHQAFALITLTQISHKIAYVIDSARFKQGKYTPGTHIPIVSPDMLDKEPVEAIIIATGGYSDEVVKILQKKFKNKIALAIIRNSQLEIINR